MIPVVIESPFAGLLEPGLLERNKKYLRRAIRDSLSRGEAPFASHRMYPGALNDLDQGERKLGIEAGYTWMSLASYAVFYCDYGYSLGMLEAKTFAEEHDILTVERYIGKEDDSE